MCRQKKAQIGNPLCWSETKELSGVGMRKRIWLPHVRNKKAKTLRGDPNFVETKRMLDELRMRINYSLKECARAN